MLSDYFHDRKTSLNHMHMFIAPHKVRCHRHQLERFLSLILGSKINRFSRWIIISWQLLTIVIYNYELRFYYGRISQYSLDVTLWNSVRVRSSNKTLLTTRNHLNNWFPGSFLNIKIKSHPSLSSRYKVRLITIHKLIEFPESRHLRPRIIREGMFGNILPPDLRW